MPAAKRPGLVRFLNQRVERTKFAAHVGPARRLPIARMLIDRRGKRLCSNAASAISGRSVISIRSAAVRIALRSSISLAE